MSNLTHRLNDTIAAIATPIGRGGIGIIRVSGPKAPTIVQTMVGALPNPRQVVYRQFLDTKGQLIDEGLVIYFKAPHSFTGEAVIELQGHGSPIVLQILLNCLLQLGARLARPGEFTERAFLNNRLDLSQAEAIVDLIHASSEQAARASVRSMQGIFSQKVATINQSIIQLRSYVEAAIDFAEEAIDFLSDDSINQQLNSILGALRALITEAKQGQRLQKGIYLVIAGLPNVGKSHLLNALSGENTAIVTEIPGTTRDVLRTQIHLDGLPLHIVDTAGLRVTNDVVEQEGIRRALVEINQADQILWVIDDTQGTVFSEEPLKTLALFKQNAITVPVALVHNKIDLTHRLPDIKRYKEHDVIYLSAKTGEGLNQLRDYLKKRVNYEENDCGFSARERHIAALVQAEITLKNSLDEWQMSAALEILAVNLAEAHHTLGEITGLFTTEELLGHIFSQFCIGK